jgi:hypothetical protein
MSKGVGIVQFETKEEAEQAIIDLDGLSLRGGQLQVSLAIIIILLKYILLHNYIYII